MDYWLLRQKLYEIVFRNFNIIHNLNSTPSPTSEEGFFFCQNSTNFLFYKNFSDEGFNFRGAYLRISERTFKNSSSMILGVAQKHHLREKTKILFQSGVTKPPPYLRISERYLAPLGTK